MTTAKSKANWGKQKERTAEELNAICRLFFESLKVPPEWKLLKWSPIYDNEIIISVGKNYRDLRTSGIDMMEYRVFFNTYSERGGVVEKRIIDFGKYKYFTVVSNKTIEKLNVWIKERYAAPQPPKGGEREDGEVDHYDGLQHFRDRFGDKLSVEIRTDF